MNYPSTSLNGALFSLCARESVNEVGKGAVAAEQLLVRAALCDFSIYQNQDEVSLRQEAHPVGHQDTGLLRKSNAGQKKHDVAKNKSLNKVVVSILKAKSTLLDFVRRYLVSKYSFGSNDFVKDVLTHMCINGRQRIIQEVNISLSVDGSGQTHPLLLPS